MSISSSRFCFLLQLHSATSKYLLTNSTNATAADLALNALDLDCDVKASLMPICIHIMSKCI
jgi:hypothetical protein